ncbi:unnamed protein product [Tilletia laevis]|nr:unnamed protein product [Tilletia laevis]CAD6977282.1 unnamed protein product [Tilletia controversa]
MLTFIKFAPLDPANHDFVFILHPHLKRRNAINDDLLQLPFVVDDEARVQLQGTTPTIRSSRVKFGIYVNHQLLGSTPFPLCDGDIVAFPQRRHNLKTAARFRVAMESLELSCGVDQELPALRGFAQELEAEEARGMSTCTSSHSSKASEPIGVGTAALRTFSTYTRAIDHPVCFITTDLFFTIFISVRVKATPTFRCRLDNHKSPIDLHPGCFSIELLGDDLSCVKHLVRSGSSTQIVVLRPRRLSFDAVGPEQHFGTDFGTGFGIGFLRSPFHHNPRRRHSF